MARWVGVKKEIDINKLIVDMLGHTGRERIIDK